MIKIPFKQWEVIPFNNDQHPMSTALEHGNSQEPSPSEPHDLPGPRPSRRWRSPRNPGPGHYVAKALVTLGRCWTLFDGWWFGTWLVFSHILGMSSSQLTNSYFSEDLKPPTSFWWGMIYKHPSNRSINIPGFLWNWRFFGGLGSQVWQTLSIVCVESYFHWHAIVRKFGSNGDGVSGSSFFD